MVKEKKTLLERIAKWQKENSARKKKECEDMKKAYSKLDIIEKISLDEHIDSKEHVPLYLLILPFKAAFYLAICYLSFLVFDINLLEPLKLILKAFFTIYPILIIMFLAILIGSISERRSIAKKLLIGRK